MLKFPARLLLILSMFLISILHNKISPHTVCHALLHTVRMMSAITSWEWSGKTSACPQFITLHWIKSDTQGTLETHASFLCTAFFTPWSRLLCGVWRPVLMHWVESKLPGSAILDMNGEYLLPPFTWARLFLRHYVFRVSYDLFFIFSWLFLSKNGSISVLLSKWNPTAHPVFKSNQHSTPSPFCHLRCNNLNALGRKNSH